jgi:hypothetical protein
MPEVPTLMSQNGQYVVTFTSGNLAVRNLATGASRTVFSAPASPAGPWWLYLQYDGNLVAYAANDGVLLSQNRVAYFATATNREGINVQPPLSLTMENSALLALYNGINSLVWSWQF